MSNQITKTHYRKAFKSPYLSAADIVGPTILTISHVTLSGDETKKTKDIFNTAYFAEKELRKGEQLKPMILNATNSKIMNKLTGSHFLEDWVNVPVTIFVDANVRFGRDTVEGLRISPKKPVIQKQMLDRQNQKNWNNAINAFKRDGNFNAVLKHLNISQQDMQFIADGVANGSL